MSATTSPVQTVNASRPATIVPSFTTQGRTYRVDESGCECDGFKYRQHCRHHDGYMTDLTAMRNAYRCRHCNTQPAEAGRIFCAPCRVVLAQFAEQGHEVPEDTFVPHAVCASCQRTYNWSDEYSVFCPSCVGARSVAA